MIDIIVIVAIALIVGGASYYIYRSKRAGKKCIGCPYSSSCKSCGCSSQEHRDVE